MPLKSGKECIILEGFGDKICKQIDEKLKTFLDDGGILHEADDSIILDSDTESDNSDFLQDITPVNSRTKAAPKNTKKVLTPTESNTIEKNILEGDSGSSAVNKHKGRVFSFASTTTKTNQPTESRYKANEVSGNNVSSDKPKTVRKNNRKYLPEPRSGPHALLITLFNNELENENRSENEPAYMLKAKLIEEAQPYCDKSFISTDRSNHFTAWNSMSGLIKKNLAVKTNNLPAKYMLTESGRLLASELLYGAQTDSEGEDAEQVPPANKIQRTSEDESPVAPYKKINEVQASEKETTAPSDLIEIESDSSSDDAITLVEDGPSNEKRPTYQRQDSDDIITIADGESSNQKKFTYQRQNSDVIVAVDDDVSTYGKKKDNSNKYLTKSYGSDSDDDLPDIGLSTGGNAYGDYAYSQKPKISESMTQKKKQTVTKKASFDRNASTGSLNEKMSSLKTKASIVNEDDEDDSYQPSFKAPSSSSSQTTPGFDPTKFLNKNTTSTAIHRPSAMFKYEPGNYDVILFVDNCEQTAKKQDILIEELRKSGIKFDIGKLHVGDFTWIARPKSASSASDKDVILNCVLERKRMDDFCSSILDGRYKEQKFRLRKCGITKQIYLIEEHGSIKHMSLPEKSLVQADVNTQLIDHLLVHHTTDPKDTAHYLIELTNYMTRAHRAVTINVCSKDDLDSYNKSDDKSDLVVNYYMTLKEFNAFSNKNKPLSLKEMFAKCLMKIQGFSQEKCLAIIDTFPSIDSLMNEYAKCPAAKREKLLANLKYGRQQKNVGPALSKVVAQLFYSETALN